MKVMYLIMDKESGKIIVTMKGNFMKVNFMVLEHIILLMVIDM